MPELPPPPAGVDADPWRAATGWIAARRASMPPAVMAVAVAAAAAVLGVIAWMAFHQDIGPPVELTLPRAGSGEDQGEAAASADGASSSAGGRAGRGTTEADVVIVHVAGAVARPGLYRLAAESRLADAVDAAGGLLADADPDAVNLAALLNDGERIYLPRRGEAIATPGASSAQGGGGGGGGSALLDLNAATAEQLEELPGVGPSTASAILDYRKEHRRFRSIDELLEVRGIGPSKFAALRSRVTVR